MDTSDWWQKGNFDIVVTNDTLERAVDELADFLTSSFPKLRGRL